MDKRIEELYEKIPASVCKEGCFECCTNIIQFSPEEEENMGGYKYIGHCSHLVNGKCSIYKQRPFVCRIYGSSETLSCEDCQAERYLTKEETEELMHEYVSIKNKQETERKNK